MKVGYWALLVAAVVAVTTMAGPAWGQCVEACLDGDNLTYRFFDADGEPFTRARIEENDYGWIFFYVFPDSGWEFVVGGITAESELMAEDGSITINFNTNYEGVFPEYGVEGVFPDDVDWETMDFGAGLEGGDGDPDPANVQLMSFEDTQGDRNFGDMLDFGAFGTDCNYDPYCGGAAAEGTCLVVSPAPPVVDESVTVRIFIDGEQATIGPEGEPMCIWDGGEVCLGEGVNPDGSLTFVWTHDMQDLVSDPYATVGVWADLCAPDPPWECDPGQLFEMPIADFVAGGDCGDWEPPAPPSPISVSGKHKDVAGANVTLSAALSGGVEGDLQWKKDGEDLEGETGADLELLAVTTVTTDDTGVYSVTVDTGDKAYEVFESAGHLLWITETALPLAGGLGLGLIAGACALAGAVSIRRKK